MLKENSLMSEKKIDSPFKSLSFSEMKEKLGFSPEGLSSEEVKKRLETYGPNEIVEKKLHPLLKFFSYFWGPIPWMIEVVLILSAFLERWPDFFMILLLLLVNSIVGFWEEWQAGNTIDALKKNLAVKARVKREGKWEALTASEIVPGDLVQLSVGDIVPADARLLGSDPIEVDQSALTGESLPVSRKEGEDVFSSSIISQGETTALVYGTGKRTFFGKTVELVQSARTISHFQKAVLRIGKNLILLATFLVSIVILFSIFKGNHILTTLQFALVLTIASIPVALPTVLSVTMAIGAKLLAKKKAIVSRLVSIEELAGVDTLCADKTGTLTQNKLVLGEPLSLNKLSSSEITSYAALACRKERLDAIDTAILNGVKKETSQSYETLHFKPFDPVHKRAEAHVKDQNGTEFDVAKGAVQVMLELSSNREEVRQSVEEKTKEFAEKGFRSLGVSLKKQGGEWELIGLLPLFDALQVDAKETIEMANAMGVKIKMLTGDQLPIAKETAKKLGMSTNILAAKSLENLSSEEKKELSETVEKVDGFAQVFPEHKFAIVEILQKKGHIVGMTGDGVNDAPALKKADCGIAVAGATDAARSAASIVMVTSGLSVMIDAIKESRKIFQRMNSYAIYRIAETLRVLFFMTLSILIFNFYPVTAIMIVMLALLNDGAILSIAFDNVHFQNRPEAWNMRMVLGVAFFMGAIGVFSSFLFFFLGEKIFLLPGDFIQSLMYLKLSLAGHLTIFLTRTRGPFWSKPPARIQILAVFGTQLLATLIAVYGLFMAPIGWGWALFVWGYALSWFFLNDRIKLLAYKIFDPKGN